MKVIITGTSSTGKTTLASKVSKRYHVPFINECAREVMEETGLTKTSKMTIEQSCDFQNRILNKKIEKEDNNETFIGDRGVIDAAAYFLRWCGRDLTQEQNKSYLEKCINQAKKYDKIVLLPWNSIPLEDDGVRSSKLYYLYEIHCLIIGLMEDNDLKYEILKETDLEKRTQYFKKFFK